MVPVRILNVWLHFKHLILFKSEVFKLKLEHLIHLFSFKFAIYARHCCSVWKALLNSFSFIVPSTSTCGEKSVKLLNSQENRGKSSTIFFVKTLNNPNYVLNIDANIKKIENLEVNNKSIPDGMNGEINRYNKTVSIFT